MNTVAVLLRLFDKRLLLRLIAFLVFQFITVTWIHANALVKPTVIDDEYFSETFSLFADLKEAGYLYGQIGITNIGPGDESGICRLLLVLPDQEPQNHNKIVDKSQWHYRSGKNERLTIADCYLEVGHDANLKFVAHVNDHKLEIMFASSASKNTVPFNQVIEDKNFYHYDILTPWSNVEVIYEVAGRKSVSGHGFGYADHSRSTFLPAKLAEKWVRFRTISNKHSGLLLARFAPTHSAPQGWTWYQEHRSPQVFKSLSLTNEKENIWNVSLEDEKGKHVITSGALLFRHAPLEERGIIGSIIGKFVGNPVTYTYRARMQSSTGHENTGIMEVTILNE